MRIKDIDHFVLTVASIPRTVEFYTTVLGMRERTFDSGRTALLFGSHKINLHEVGHEIDPKAGVPTPGSADLCLLVEGDLTQIVRELRQRRVSIVLGPVNRTGARGPIRSIYIRDPDANLIELSVYR
ncbi:VOC family protein [Bifidobacterium sp. ESL0732]|uniref:VOC family protein n=1 Tax=Bifidobacterium sp. ESL0732 TaxID=2983222 RepID=UPI0023F95FB3|nr:VOC family protein [Bifidobacterium sp. ESL0732]WEV64475.1 VOC family protein [Bifidobacterium sp. ESL0732]